MNRTVTAIFQTADVAQSVKAQIEQLGVSGSHIDVLGGADRADDVSQLNLPHDEAVTYREAVREGHHVVSADVPESHVDEAMQIMRHPEGGVDIDAYETEYRGRDTYDTDLADYGTGFAGYGGAPAGTEAEDGRSVELAEERIAIGTREVDRGTTHVRTYVQEVPVEERVRLRQEHVSVDRRATDGERVVTGAEADALFEERDIAVHETDEEAVVSKEAVVTEEVVVGKEVTEREEVVTDTVRKTEVDIDKGKDKV